LRQVTLVSRPEDEPKQVCPGLFYAVPAQDGLLFRIRIPGGILTVEQTRMLAQFTEQFGDGGLQVTNRANIQIRTRHPEISGETLTALQQVGLARDPQVDHLRNLMGSPTAGIDPAALIDVRPLIEALDRQISSRTDLAGLPAKFSIGIDGGEAVSVRNRSNEIWLVAARSPNPAVDEQAAVGFQVLLSTGEPEAVDTGIWVKPADGVAVVIAMAEVYLELATAYRPPQGKKPRLKKILEIVGIAEFLKQVKLKLIPVGLAEVMQSERRDQSSGQSDSDQPLGVHAQVQPGFCYIGLNLKLGNLTTLQLHQLADLVESVGNATLRLTPWQTVLIADIPDAQLATVQQQLAAMGFSWQPEIWSALVACAGSPGCAAAATPTQLHAQEIAAVLASEPFNRPINIHLTGCAKSCAQRHRSDIALLGKQTEQQQEVYELFVTGDRSPLGRSLYAEIPATQISDVIQRLIHTYHQQTDEPFQQFVSRYSVSELQQLFSQVSGS
jgi:ferredoxin-nitrite reductase